LEGNPGHRPIQEEPEYKPAQIPKCPTHLKGEARREWKRVSKELFEHGLLAPVDRAALACYCQSYADWVRATKELEKENVNLVLESEKGGMYQNPWVSILNKAKADMKAFMVEFGMTPASRGKVSPRKSKDPGEQEYEDWLFGRKQ
jgi:P27 family predicted phage terminase small subunit